MPSKNTIPSTQRLPARSVVKSILLAAILLTSTGSVSLAQWKFLTNPEATQLTALTFDRQGNLWAVNVDHYSRQAKLGVLRYDGASWRTFTNVDGLSNDTIEAITIDRVGRPWVAGKGVIAYLDNEQWHSVPIQDTLSSIRDYVAIVCDSSDNIWASSVSPVFHDNVGGIPGYLDISQVHKFDGRRWITFDLTSEDSSQAGNSPVSLVVDPYGVVWGAGPYVYSPATRMYYGGLHKFDGDSWNTYTLGGSAQIHGRQVNTIDCSKTGEIFIGYHNQGDSKFCLEKFNGTLWGGAISSETPTMFSMKIDRSGRRWICSGGVQVYDNDSTLISNFDMQNSKILSNLAYSIAFAPNGDVWMSSQNGISILQNPLEAVQNKINSIALSASPNPTAASTTISFTPEAAGHAEISVMNMLGVEVARVFSGEVDASEHRFMWETGKMPVPRGVYECVVRMNGTVQVVPVIVQ